MNPIDKRKAELREYIEARAKATQEQWRPNWSPSFWTEYGYCSYGTGPLKKQHPNISEIDGARIDAEFIAKAANESARIAEQLLECIEALEKVKQEYWNRGYAGSGTIKALSINDFDNMIDKTLNKIAGEK